MKKGLLLPALLVSLALAGCGLSTPAAPAFSALPAPSSAAGARAGEATVAYPLSFTDHAGNLITLEQPPKRVAVLFSSFADLWTTAGGTVAITVGESIERGFVPPDTPLVDGGAGKAIDRELLLNSQPDFVLCTADIPAQLEAAAFLNRAGIPAAAFRVESFADYRSVLKLCTDITGDADAFATFGTEVGERIDAMLAADAISRGSLTPEILFIRAGSKNSATKAKTAKENFVCAMLQELQTHNIAEDAPVLLDGLSLEEILLRDPDFIFISTMGDEQAARAHMDAVLADPAWQQLTAIQNGRYAYLPKELFQFKPNQRWDEAYAYLIDLLRPEETT